MERQNSSTSVRSVYTFSYFVTGSIKGNGKALFDLVKQQQLEGIVLKKKDSNYEIGKRSSNWLKVVNYQYATVEIAGFRKSNLVGYYGFLTVSQQD